MTPVDRGDERNFKFRILVIACDTVSSTSPLPSSSPAFPNGRPISVMNDVSLKDPISSKIRRKLRNPDGSLGRQESNPTCSKVYRGLESSNGITEPSLNDSDSEEASSTPKRSIPRKFGRCRSSVMSMRGWMQVHLCPDSLRCCIRRCRMERVNTGSVVTAVSRKACSAVGPRRVVE